MNPAALNVAISGIGAEAAIHAEKTMASVQRRNLFISQLEKGLEKTCAITIESM